MNLNRLRKYLQNLSNGRMVLWFYFIWYAVVVIRYPDARLSIWFTALGLSAIIGTALWINTALSGSKRIKLEFWQIVRLYSFPFCVSSFSSLVKEKNFFFIFSPNPYEMLFAAALCGALWLTVAVLKWASPGGSSSRRTSR